MLGYTAHQTFTDYWRWTCIFDSEGCMFDDSYIWDDSCMNSGDLYSHNERRLLCILCNALTNDCQVHIIRYVQYSF